MQRTMCKGKIHRATVTQANLNYIGSITIDQDLLEASDIYPYEKVQVVNAWKIAYLQRLQQQNTDSSYIDAYLKAWNLPASALSAGPKK